MNQHRKLTWVLGGTAAALAVTFVGWAVLGPLAQQRKALQHVAEAHRQLSPPLSPNTIDLNGVDCAQAERELIAALDLNPGLGLARRELALAQGCAAFQRGDHVLADRALTTARQRLRGDARPLRWLGALALERDRPTAAVTLYEQALELDSEDLASRVGLADALAEAGQPRSALAVLTRARTAPLAVIALRQGLLRAELGQPAKARAAYREALALSPDRSEPLNNLAILEEEEGNLDQAWDYQEKALALSPDDPVMLFNTGLLAIRIGYDTKAFRLLRRAAELDRESPDPARALADQLLVTGQPQAALDALGPALDRFPQDAALRNSVGNTLSALGRHLEGQAAYRRAIELAPHLAEPHNGLAVLALAAGDLDRAQAELDQAARLDPNNREVRRNLAEVRRRRRTNR